MACSRCGNEGHNKRSCGRKVVKKPVTRRMTQAALEQQREFKKAKAKSKAPSPTPKGKETAKAHKKVKEEGLGEREWCAQKVRDIEADLTKKQVKSIRSKKRRRASLCGRRAGKTWGPACAQLLLSALENDESLNVYITLSRKVARRIIWPMLKKFDRRYKLNMSFNNLELEVTLPNGSMIWVTGATDENDIEKLRGSAYHCVVVDECASFGLFFEVMIDEVIEPALEDYDGVLHLIGTPAAACVGYFHKVTTNPKQYFSWDIQTWTVLDNPMFPRWVNKETGRPYDDWEERAAAWLKAKKKEKGWDDTHPVYRREWKGEWVRDEGGLVYQYDSKRNDASALFNPNTGKLLDGDNWGFTLGVDLGFADPTGFTLLAYSTTRPLVVLVEDEKKSGLITDDIAARIQDYMTRYPGLRRVVMDTGGLGKSIAVELTRRFSLPIFPAEKNSKYSFIKLMNSDFRTGRMLVHPGAKWIDEGSILQWDDSGTKEDDRFENHLTDAALYAWRDALHWQVKVRKAEHLPEEGTIEWQVRQAAEAKKRAIQTVKRRKAGRGKVPFKRWNPTSNASFH